MNKPILTATPGLVVGMMTLLERVGRGTWLMRCECGAKKRIRFRSVSSGHTISCGCYGKRKTADRLTTHGHSTLGKKSRTYQSWQHMLERCINPNLSHAKYYIGKGITVCDRWANSFPDFLADMGERPAGKSIDRIDGNKGYYPENCRWACAKQQRRNASNCKLNQEIANEILALKGLLSSRAAGKKFSISYHVVLQIWRGKLWVPIAENSP